MRKAEAFRASLLPHQKQRMINQELEEVRLKIFEIDNEDAINEAEKRAQERIARGLHKAPRKKKKGKE